jgi:DNA polymerase-3 subunit delta
MEVEYRAGGAESLWKSGISPVYLFFGAEDNLKHEAVEALVKQVVSPDFADFDLEVMDASSVTADVILASAGQVPFGSEKRMVVVRGMEQWREKSRSADAERLAEGIARLGNSTCLVLVASAEEEEARRKTAVTLKLDNAAKKIGAVVNCRALEGRSLQEWVMGRVREEGKQIDRDAVELLIHTVGNEMLLLEHEVIKLVCYVGDIPKVTMQDVGAVTASSPEDVVFTLIEAITQKQTDRALMLLQEVHRYDPKPQAVAGKLLALLSRQYRMIWQARHLVSQRVSPHEVRSLSPDLLAELPTEGSIVQVHFKAGDLFRLAREYTFEQLERVFEQLLLCDLANKGNVLEDGGVFSSDPEGNLKLLVLILTGNPLMGKSVGARG